MDGEEDGLLNLWIAPPQQDSISIMEFVITIKHCQDALKASQLGFKYDNIKKSLYNITIFSPYIFSTINNKDQSDITIPSSHGMYYEVYLNKKLNWDGASEKCKARDGILATIGTLKEKNSIVNSIASFLSGHGKNWQSHWRNLWIGLRKGTMYINYI